LTHAERKLNPTGAKMPDFKNLWSISKRFAVTAVVCVATSANAAPPLQKTDWKSFGDGLLLLDTDTNLKWLSLTQTLNLSVNDLMGQWFGSTSVAPLVGSFSNFRYATLDEIGVLYGHFGITAIDNTDVLANWIGANVAFQALGVTGSNATVKLQEGLSIVGPGVASAPEIVATAPRQTARAFVFPTQSLTNQYSFDGKKGTMGSYLIMVSPVPEPGSLTMFLVGLSMVGLLARRRDQPRKS
jgi:hypothetical protein